MHPPKSKIGYIVRKFPNLSETFILNEILELEERGHDIHIFSLDRPNDPCFHKNLPKLKANVTYIPNLTKIKQLLSYKKRAARTFRKNYKKTLFFALQQCKPTLFFRFFQSCFVAIKARKMGIQHFHAHFANRPTTIAYLTSMISGHPYSFTAHAVDIFKETLCRKALQKKIQRAKFVITVSEYNKNYLSQQSNGPTHKIYKINNGINLELFQPKDIPPQNPFTFLCVARFVAKKGHMVLLEACNHLRNQGLDFQCLLVGKGKLQSKIESFINKKKLQNHVKLLGPHSQEQVLMRYNQSHAFVLPCVMDSDGNRDGLPVSIVEALACSLPVITTPMTGNSEVVHHQVNGLLVPLKDAQAFAEAMRSLMLNRDLYEQYRENARQSIQDRFDIHKTIVALADLFEEIS